jgi:hypothetical protein
MPTETNPQERVPYWGVDQRLEDRPGVPREAPPHALANSHWTVPEQQIPTVVVLKRADLARLTPVFGTAQPPHGLSGMIRRIAYGIPDQFARHWLLLLLADRVDSVGSRLGRLGRIWPFTALVSLGARLRDLWRGRRR